MKIAIFLTGHIRRAHKCTQYLQEQFLGKHDCDIFISTWDRKSNWNVFPDHPEYESLIRDHDIIVDQNYIDWVYPVSITDNIKGIFIHGSKDYAEYRTPLYGENYQANRLFDQYYVTREAYDLCPNINEYDLVFKNRCDVQINSVLPIVESPAMYNTAKTFFSPWPDGSIRTMEDKMFWGPPNIVTPAFFLYDNCQRLAYNHEVKMDDAEALMGHYITRTKQMPVTLHDVTYVTPAED